MCKILQRWRKNEVFDWVAMENTLWLNGNECFIVVNEFCNLRCCL